MFVKGKGAFQFERPHDGEACAVGKTEILVGVSFKNRGEKCGVRLAILQFWKLLSLGTSLGSYIRESGLARLLKKVRNWSF